MATLKLDEAAIFDIARQIAAAEARNRFIQASCGEDRGLQARVEALLRVNDEQGSFLESPVASLQGAINATFSEGVGTQIGPYKLIEQIGEGGFGVVFMAEQQHPIRRRVALKVLKAGMDTRQVVARFEAERQALALMEHVGIARVLDGGEAPFGRPYFVMELVKGIPITRFCDEHQLTPRERLALFAQVCQAVQHAHQKGIIHRDLKPTNVLVAAYDGKPAPKVIDFGVAKALGQQLTERTLVTGFGSIVGTLEYMSPEQAEFNAMDVDTRADIYSLGVLLYELLTGTTPLSSERLKLAAMTEVLRLIREEEPPKPSTRLSDSRDTLPSISAQRRLEPARLTKEVRGELDWIVMKALEKDRNRRYETANGLARDIDRYLNDEPVEASSPGTGYRLRKFVRRNRGPVLAVSLLLVALAGGVVGTTLGLVRAEQARRAAGKRAEGERVAKELAEKRLAQIEKAIGILGSMFENLDPMAEEQEGRPLRAILGERLDQAAAELQGEAVGDRVVVAQLQDRLGQTYLGLGYAAKAEALFDKAARTRQDHLGADHPLTLGSKQNQAVASAATGNGDQAIYLFQQVRDARTAVLGADHRDTLSTVNELARLYNRVGKPNTAVPLLEQVRDGRIKQLGEDHDQTLTTLQALAEAYLSAGKPTEAIALAEKVWDAQVRKHGDDDPRAIEAMGALAYVYQGGYKMKQALTLFEQARDKTVPKLGPYHPLTLKTLNRLGHMYRAYGRTPEAIALLELVRERELMVLGGHHPLTLTTLWDLALAYRKAGELNKALLLCQQSAAGVERLNYAHSYAHVILESLASCHEQLNQFDQAEVWRRKLLPVVKMRNGPESAEYAEELTRLGSNLLKQKKPASAEPILRESLAILVKQQPGAQDTFHTESLLGAALLGRQKYADAEPLLVRGYLGISESAKAPRQKNHDPRTGQRLIDALERLVEQYDAWGKPDEAAKRRKELEEAKARFNPH
jgi:eukaryotic-like serine/threonine-protein kinase